MGMMVKGFKVIVEVLRMETLFCFPLRKGRE